MPGGRVFTGLCGTSDLEIGWGVRGTGRDCHDDRGTVLLRSSSPRLPRCSVPRGVEVAIAGGQGGAHRRLGLLRPDLVVAESRRCRPPRCAGRCCRWRLLPPSTPVVMSFHGAPSSSSPGLRSCRSHPAHRAACRTSHRSFRSRLAAPARWSTALKRRDTADAAPTLMIGGPPSSSSPPPAGAYWPVPHRSSKMSCRSASVPCCRCIVAPFRCCSCRTARRPPQGASGVAHQAATDGARTPGIASATDWRLPVRPRRPSASPSGIQQMVH
jgi:hypothetical protein